MNSLPILSDSIQSYLLEINRYPVLSPKDEFTVAERYSRNRNIEDAHKLVTSNLRYVVRIALEYRNYGCRLADLIQEGNIGLMVAVKKFNPHKGFRLITYATWWIRSFIQEFILKANSLVRHGSKALKKKLFYKKGNQLEETNTVRENAGPQPADHLHDLSLNSPLTSGDKTSYMDMLQDARPGQEEDLARKEESAIVKDEVTNALALLNDKERLIIEKRVMAEEPESLQCLGDRLGLTRERVRQIENEAIRKLQRRLSCKLGPVPEPA